MGLPEQAFHRWLVLNSLHQWVTESTIGIDINVVVSTFILICYVMIFNKGSFVVLPILIKSTYYVYVYCTIMYRYPSFGRFFIMSPGSSIQLTLLNKQKCLFIYKWTNIVLIINVLYLPASTEFSNQYNNHILYACHCQRLFHIKKKYF